MSILVIIRYSNRDGNMNSQYKNEKFVNFPRIFSGSFGIFLPALCKNRRICALTAKKCGRPQEPPVHGVQTAPEQRGGKTPRRIGHGSGQLSFLQPALEPYFCPVDRAIRKNSLTSRGVVNAETLARRVPVSNVPAVWWASGAQCSPERRATPRRPSSNPRS